MKLSLWILGLSSLIYLRRVIAGGHIFSQLEFIVFSFRGTPESNEATRIN